MDDRTNEVVRVAADEILDALDRMLADLPAEANLEEIVAWLLDDLSARFPKLMKPIQEGRAARQAVQELGIKI